MFLLIEHRVKMTVGLIISIHLMFLLIGMPIYAEAIEENFNTSHVSINHRGKKKGCCPHPHFNTSHVSINRKQSLQKSLQKSYFNTSHVSINQEI